MTSMVSIVLVGVISMQTLGTLTDAGATFSIPASYGRTDTSSITTTTSQYATDLDVAP